MIEGASMFIKVWNSHDMRVMRVNRGALRRLVENTKEKFSAEQLKEVRQIAKEFQEMMALEFAHNLRRGWEKGLLNEGKFLTLKGEELISVKQVKEAIVHDGEIQFFSYKKGKSVKTVDSFRKPAHLRWE